MYDSLIDFALTVSPLTDQTAHIANVEEKKILDLLPCDGLNFWQVQNDTLDRCQEGTGEWIFCDPAFQAWSRGEIRHLWCPGHRTPSPTGLANVELAGVGKTILAYCHIFIFG
jgi:hypothetical protein